MKKIKKMNKLKKKTETKRGKFILIIFAGSLLLIPFVLSYNILINISIKQEPLTTNDLLSFCSAVVSFLGTVILSSLALWQNHSMHKYNADILKKEHRYALLPLFDICGVTIDRTNPPPPGFWEEAQFIEENGEWTAEIQTFFEVAPDCDTRLYISLKNIGDGIAKNLKISYDDPAIEAHMLTKKEAKSSIFREEYILRHITRKDHIATFDFSLPLLMDNADHGYYSVQIEYYNIYDQLSIQFVYISLEHTGHYKFNAKVDMADYS